MVSAWSPVVASMTAMRATSPVNGSRAPGGAVLPGSAVARGPWLRRGLAVGVGPAPAMPGDPLSRPIAATAASDPPTSTRTKTRASHVPDLDRRPAAGAGRGCTQPVGARPSGDQPGAPDDRAAPGASQRIGGAAGSEARVRASVHGDGGGWAGG